MSHRPGITPEYRIWALVVGAAALQGFVWFLVHYTTLVSHDVGVGLQVAVLWAAIVTLAGIAARRIGWLTRKLTQGERAHLTTLDQVGQLEIQNALLTQLSRSIDVGLAFQSLARQIARLVECDRLGLALLTEDGQGFQTYTARVSEEERRHRPRPDIEFSTDRTLLGDIIRKREPRIVSDVGKIAPDYLDANVLRTSGFRSALFLPLIARGRVVGTINLVSRSSNAFAAEHVEALRPVAEILAVAILAQQWQVLLAKYRTTEGMADMTLSAANEINSALQAIIGHCNVLDREHPDNAALQRDAATIVRQAQRITELLEKMRRATQDRLHEMAVRVHDVQIPTSPEEIEDDTR